jgi:ferredoxin
MTARAPGRAVDILRWPVIGPFLGWRHARTTVQLAALGITAMVVLHGLLGPAIAPANLATVVTWVHYRGLLIVALLAAGNLFCTGCPFVLVRDAGRRLHAPSRRWPRWLRHKWPAVALFVGVLFAYELFDLWSLPAATAWLILGYFGAALAVDLVFSGASFCKYVCPIGQFNFLASTLAPLEIQVRQPETCRTCQTVDCIRGRRDVAAPAVVVQRGCELALFLPSKVGNLDCTLCLDCVHACPHDNVALAARVPGLELADARRRSGLGRLTRRWDIAALVVVFVFGALLNMLGMIAPVYAAEQWLARALGTTREMPALALLFVIGLAVVPSVLLGAAGWGAVLVTGGAVRRHVAAYIYALVPVGTGIWAAHYAFHLLTGLFTIVPVAQSAAADLAGRAILGAPLWTWTGLRPGAVFPLQVGLVVLGSVGSLAVAFLVAERESPDRAGAAVVPWAAVTLMIAAAALWMLTQPMEMRAAGVLG